MFPEIQFPMLIKVLTGNQHLQYISRPADLPEGAAFKVLAIRVNQNPLPKHANATAA